MAVYTNFTEDEFRQRFGRALDNVIQDDDEPATKTSRTISLVCEQIEDYILSNTVHIDFDNLEDAQITYINKAAMEQLYYILSNGDFARNGGYNALNQMLISQSELNARMIAPRAKNILNAHIISRCF